ncbi:MAG: hypothetical protein ACI9C1_001696 [Candidatus Aldehydirespiratoraceae bacterium]|jgi:hypothetical protein
MIRHTVLLSLNGVEESLIDTVITQLRALPAIIPEIHAFAVGRDLALRDDNATVMIAGDFANLDDYQVYSTHPEHVRVIEDHIKPYATGLVRAQVEL